MSDENNPTEVFIQREGRTWRWGQSHYLKTWNGNKQTLSKAAMQVIALPIAGVIGISTFFFSAQRELSDVRGSPVEIPQMTEGNQVPPVPIMTLNEMSSANPKRGKLEPREIARIKVVSLRSNSAIPVGSEARAILESGASNGIVKAKLMTSLNVDGEPVVPRGATIFGRGKSSEERLFVEFQKVIFPNGESLAIRGQAFDIEDKILGLKGAFVGARSKKIGLAIGFGLLGGVAEGLEDSSGSSIWGANEKKSMRDAALSGASKAALDQSRAYMDEIKNTSLIIEVKKGTEFYLIIDEPKKEETE